MSTRRFTQAAFLFCAFLLPDLNGFAATINVPANQPTIQAGINTAVAGDIVLVSPGTYYENINFSGKAITVTSASGPAATIIDGSKESSPTVTFSSSEKVTSILSGFTLRNGYSEQISISYASPTIKGNVIIGIPQPYYNYGIYIQGGSAIIQGNIISNSSSGGISAFNTSGVHYTGNLIANNGSVGLLIQDPAIADRILQNTISANAGGGISYYPYSTVGLTLTQNVITNNSEVGVEVINTAAPLTIVSNTIANNQYCCGGSGASELQLGVVNTLTTIDNNLVVALGDSPALSCQSQVSTPVIKNNDVFAENNVSYAGSCADPTGTNGNLDVDPLFLDSTGNNYLLQASSLAVNAGFNTAPGEPTKDMVGNARIVGGTIDIGADEYSAKPVLALSTYDLHFPSEQVGKSSSPQSITLTNNSTSAVTLNLIATNLNFSQTNNCGVKLAAAASCQISVTFSPAVGGSANGTLGIISSATLNPVAVKLVGTGLAPQVNFYASFYFFGQVIGTSKTQTGTLSNVGDAPLTISNISLSGPSDFVETSNCPIAPKTLAIQGSCTISVTFTPTIIGSETGTATITDNASPNSQTGNVDASSVSAGIATLSPSMLTFPQTLIGQKSAPQTVSLTNTGTGPLTITNFYTIGDFPQTNNCPAVLAKGASCTVTITFTPSQEGNANGDLFIYNDSANSNAILQVSGIGQAPVPTLTALSIASAPAGSQSANLTVTGTGFVYGSQVLINDVPLGCCSFPNGTTQINVTVPTAVLANPGTYQVSVFTGTPGGGTSNSLPFTVYKPTTYAFKSVAYDYRTITGTNLNLINGATTITSPFPIQFAGGSYTNLIVSEYGTVSFDSYPYSYNGAIPTPNAQTLIAPFWAGLYAFGSSPGTDNNGFWQVLGSAPSRQLVVEWRDVSICCETTNTIKFQVVFFEGSGNIQFNYADTVFGGSYTTYDNGGTATAGIQELSTMAQQYSYDQPKLLSQTSLLWYPTSPTASLSSSSLNLGYHQLDTKSLPQKVTLTNGGLAPLAISSIATNNPDFTQTNNCTAILAPQKSCIIQVYFTPSQPSAETATLTITDNATNSPQTASLTGIGTITSTVVYPILANFGTVNVGTSASLPIVLANSANVPLTIQQITTSPSVYSQTNNCGTSLAPGASCIVTVTFTPTQAVNVPGTLSMGLNSKPAITEVTLAGSGH